METTEDVLTRIKANVSAPIKTPEPVVEAVPVVETPKVETPVVQSPPTFAKREFSQSAVDKFEEQKKVAEKAIEEKTREVIAESVIVAEEKKEEILSKPTQLTSHQQQVAEYASRTLKKFEAGLEAAEGIPLPKQLNSVSRKLKPVLEEMSKAGLLDWEEFEKQYPKVFKQIYKETYG